jgi:hypothetical protein
MRGTNPGWTRDGIEFFAFGQNQPDVVVPVYQFYSNTGGDWKTRFSLMENPELGPGWFAGGISFYAHGEPAPNTMAVYEYRNPNFVYRYSTNGSLDEQDWPLQGVRFHTFGATPA